MNTAYLGLGSNLGRRPDNLRTAIKLLKECGIKVIKKSKVYEFEAVSKIKQRRFLNMCIKISTIFTPEKLLEICKLIENQMGRKRLKSVRIGYWEPRIIDLDILIFGDKKIAKKNLKIPHPRMCEREFVLKPLAEIHPKIHNLCANNSN